MALTVVGPAAGATANPSDCIGEFLEYLAVARNVSASTIYTHVMSRPGMGVVSPLDDGTVLREEPVAYRVTEPKQQQRRRRAVVRDERPYEVLEDE